MTGQIEVVCGVNFRNRIKKFFLVSILGSPLLFTPLVAKTYYVSTSGSDSATGTIDHPLLTIPKAYALAVAGDTIFVRGGTYSISTTISLSKSGTSANRYYLWSYPGERAVLDCTSMAVSSSNRGIKLSGSYWYIKGFDVRKAGDNGMNVSGSNNTIEFCSFSENADTGLQLGGGASNNQVINCDSFFNVDPSQGNADGFSPKLDVGTGNYFYGCRSWQNSDDGWDGYLRPRPSITITTTLENCWSFMNGYLKSGSASTGNGNGFKMGGSDSANLEHNFILKRCLSFGNRVKGFDENNNRGSMTLYNCTGYQNGTNYSIPGPIDSGRTAKVVNCVALGSYGTLGSFVTQITDSWLSPFTVSTTDFVSVDTTGVRGSRNADGSLPNVSFMHLATGSDLVNAGTDVGLPYIGSAPDLGAFESNVGAGVETRDHAPQNFRLDQNFPNPFNPSTTITFAVNDEGPATLKVFNVLGEDVADLFQDVAFPGRTYRAGFIAKRLPSGVYWYVLNSNGKTSVGKMMLLK